MDLFLFYISEYSIYTLILIAAIVGSFFALRYHREEGSINRVVCLIAIIIAVLFTNLGAFIVRPYFTSHAKYDGGHGTGSFINSTDVITNAHVAGHCSRGIEVRAKSGTYQGKLIAVLKRGQGDLAFVRTNANEKNFILLSNEKPKIGDIIFFPNYTEDPADFDKIKGKIIRLGKEEDGLEFVAPKGRAGNSGSPLYNKKGYVVGIVHSASFFSPTEIGTDIDTVVSFALKNNIQMFYAKNQNIDLTKSSGFYDDFAVGVICK